MHGKLLSQQEKADRVAVITASLEDSEAPHTNDESLRADEDHKRKEELWGFVTYRQSFVTKSGKLGLEPRGMDVYDDIVVLWGEQCLIVARKAEHGQWITKGECFVEEWMQGDVVNALVHEEEKENAVFEFVCDRAAQGLEGTACSRIFSRYLDFQVKATQEMQVQGLIKTLLGLVQ